MEKETAAVPRARAADAAPARTLMRKCDCPAGTPCSCAEQESMQRSAAGPGPAGGIPAVVGQVTGAGGAPLGASLRERFESRFGVDFSSVRIHTGSRANESARAVNALAYTVGRDIVFADGHYAPHTERGARLLAHELTHVVQQGGDAVSPGTVDAISEANDPSEREADEIAGEVMG